MPAATTTSFTCSFVPNKASFTSILPHPQRAEPAKPRAIKSLRCSQSEPAVSQALRPHQLSPVPIFWKSSTVEKSVVVVETLQSFPLGMQPTRFVFKPNKRKHYTITKYIVSTIQLTRTGRNVTAATFYPASACFRISPTNAWVAGTVRGGAWTGCLVQAQGPILSHHGHLLCHTASGTSWCPWRGKEGKQETFSFTKCRISNSVEIYARMPEVPSPVPGRQSLCGGKRRPPLSCWHGLVLRIRRNPWWRASYTVPPFISPWQMHLILAASQAVWKGAAHGLFEIQLGLPKWHLIFRHQRVTLVISEEPRSMPQDNRHVLPEDQQQQRG